MTRQYGSSQHCRPRGTGVACSRAIVGELQAALADCNEALRLEPNVAATFDSARIDLPEVGRMGFGHRRLQFGAATRSEAGKFALRTRGCQAQRRAISSEGNADLAAAKKLEANIVEDFVRYGVQ